MKLKQILYLTFLIQVIYADENNGNNRQIKVSEIKKKILNNNLMDVSFQKHPKYILLKKNLNLELKNLRNTQFENDSLYKNEVKKLKAKNDSLILKLFRELIKK